MRKSEVDMERVRGKVYIIMNILYEILKELIEILFLKGSHGVISLYYLSLCKYILYLNSDMMIHF